MPRLLFIPLLFLFLRCHAQSQLKLDYIPLAVIADFNTLKGIKEATILNTLIIGRDTVMKKEVSKWYRYRNDSLIATRSREFHTKDTKLDFAFEEGYEYPCSFHKRYSYTNSAYENYWSKDCRYYQGKTYYQLETAYMGEEVIWKQEITNTQLSDTKFKFRWREWHHDTLVADSSRLKIHKTFKPSARQLEEEMEDRRPRHHTGVYMTRDDKGKPFQYTNDTYNGAYGEREAWSFIYEAGAAHASRVDYAKWSEAYSYGPVPQIWLENYVGDVPTRAVYRRSDGGQEVVFIVEVVIK